MTDSPAETWSIDDGGDVATVQDEHGAMVATFHGAQAYRMALQFVASYEMVEGIEMMDQAMSQTHLEAGMEKAVSAVALSQMTYGEIEIELGDISDEMCVDNTKMMH